MHFSAKQLHYLIWGVHSIKWSDYDYHYRCYRRRLRSF